MPGKIRVTILDDHQSIVDGYIYRLNQKPEINVVATLAFGDQLESTLAEHPTDVLLLDFSIPTGPLNRNLYPTLTQIPKLLQLYPDLDILVISMFSERGLIKAVMEAGASGYIIKDDSAAIQNLGNIVLYVAEGGIYLSHKVDNYYQKPQGSGSEEPTLTHRQLEVLLLCAAFPNNKTEDLARKMTVSNSTVRNLLSGTYLRLGVNTRAAAIEKARKMGLLSADIPTAPRIH
jgi:two-component system nitrate/nitrite response regulator NarL